MNLMNCYFLCKFIKHEMFVNFKKIMILKIFNKIMENIDK